MKKRNPYKVLIGNSIIFAIGNIGSKLITFFMLPLYTYTLTKNEYGVTDLVQTTVSFMLPVVYMSVSDAVLRFGMENYKNPRKVFSVGFVLTCTISVLVLAFTIVLQAFSVQYALYVGLFLIVQSFQSVLSQMAKAIGKQGTFAANGIILALITALLNVLALVVLKLGVMGYFWSLILGLVISDLYLCRRIKIQNLVDIRHLDAEKLKEMLRYSIPLIPNAISWWASNDINRYFILLFIGSAGNGIFAVSSKIPSILNLLNSIFFQSWQLSAIEQYDDKENRNFYTVIFRAYSQFLFLATLILICLTKVFMTILVSPNFFIAWKYTPFLLVTVLYQCFSGLIGQIYVAAKKTKNIFSTTIIGMVVNVILTAILLPLIGLQGAGISSAISFLVVWLVRQIQVEKLVHIEINCRNIILNNIIIMIQIALLFFDIKLKSYVLLSMFVITISLFVNKELIENIIFQTKRLLFNK
ncbi:lipopolysaccharide biosynthesis protein [Ligilactobacillus acidipiscis]|uniref:lipopolysaccharide biosynthesis protein n=1 Tax=Ligilactobacillus acidipiscis TaxID=89059 RepID=UPI0022E911E4|nr:polysaccharide biosynthesis C-terminal domain-containing protein [Ligilactobacillus acidipiscis]